MTENKQPESILIVGRTVRNLIHKSSIRPFRGSQRFEGTSHGARVRNVLRSGRSVV